MMFAQKLFASIASAGVFALVVGLSPSFAQVQKTSLAVARVVIDPAAANDITGAFSAATLTREIELAFDSTQTFTVVSRGTAQAAALLDERIETRRGSLASVKAKFIVVPEVQGFSLRQETRPVPHMSGRTVSTHVGEINAQITLLSVADASVKSRFPVEASFTGSDRLGTTEQYSAGSGATSMGFVELAKATARAIVERVLNEVYPVQVILRQGDTVYLSRGQDSGYAKNEVLRVYSGDGARLIHPITKEDLGSAEALVGKVRVTDVLPKSTTAQVIESVGEIKAGSIVRR